MSLVLQDRVRETTNTTGTGTFTLLGAVTGYQSFSVIGNGNTCFYACADQGGPNWEVGLGTYSSGTLARTTVLSSSNSGSLVNFTAGTKDVFVTQPSEKAVYLDGSGNITPSSVGPLTVSSLTDSGLTSGRVTYAGTGGLLQDSANLTFNGTTLTANTLNLTNALTTSYGGTGLTSFTAGDLPYYSTGTALSKLAIGTNGYILQSNGSAPTWVLASSVIGGAGGSNTQVQYNSSGSLAGSANMTFNGTTLTLANDASISGLTVGKGGGSVSTNTAAGYLALSGNSTGTYNTSVGYGSLVANNGIGNTASGSLALYSNTSGTLNTAFGGANGSIYSALQQNTTGSYNTAVGGGALGANTTASNNTAVGYIAAYSTTTGYGIVAVGNAAGTANTTGQEWTAIGANALASNTTGSYNTAIGRQALNANTTASNNTAVGYQAGYSNTTGAGNAVFGYQAGYTNVGGNYNTLIGLQAGYSMTGSGATYNTFMGLQAGYSVTSGIANTFIGCSSAGYGAGYLVTTGSYNTVLGGYNGNQGGLDIRTASNYIVLSDGAGNICGWRHSNDSWNFGIATTTNSGVINLYGQAVSGGGPILQGFTGAYGSSTAQWYIGSNSGIKGGTTYSTLTATAGGTSGGVNLTSGATSWTSASDARLKNVTGTYTNALSDIAQLQPVKFTWKSDTENKPQVGVLAQSVQSVVPEAIDHIRVDKEDETDYLGVRYTELIPLLIASIQELNAKVTALEAKLGA